VSSKRGGYRRKAPLYALNFEGDEEFDGLEIMAKSMPLREFMEIGDLQKAAQDDPDAQRDIIKRLADVIVSWNLEDDEGKAVPVSYDSLTSYDFPFVLTIFYAWMNAVSSVPNLLKNDSNAGGTSQELSIPMEPL